MADKKSSYNKASNRIQRIASLIGALLLIGGALTGVYSWASSRFATAVSEQISDFQSEMEMANKRHEQTIARVELMMLMEHDPNNVTAIGKMARYYFKTLDGDLYMTQRYSDWCKQYGGDPTIVIGDK